MSENQVPPIAKKNNTVTNNHVYRPDIDGLRALAVLLVVFFHAGFVQVSGGFVGVDIFFVISGYLISGIISRELDDGHFSFADFYARRMKRICPALFAVLGLCAIAGLLWLIPDDLRNFGTSIPSAVFFYSNWLFYTQVSYFDGPAIEKPLLHTWSLAIEEQFYLIWPICIFGVYRAFGQKALSNIILVLLCVSLAASQIVLGQDQARAFYLLPYRAWELLLGAYLAVGPYQTFSRIAVNFLGLAGFAAIAYAASSFDSETPFPGVHALIPCLGAAALIYAGMQQPTLSGRILSFSPLRFVGRISYSLYLVHWPLFSFTHIALGQAPSREQRLAIIVASVAMAGLSYRFVETPARRATLRFSVLLQGAGSAAVLLALCGILFHATNGLPVRVSKSVQIASEAKHPGRESIYCRYDAPLQLAGHSCSVGAPASDMQYDFVIWGDSHARHLAPAFSGQAISRGLAGLVIGFEGCPPFLKEEHVSNNCKESNTEVQKWIKTQTRLKTVFLAGYWNAYARLGLLTVPQTEDTVIDNPVGRKRESADRMGFRETFRLLRSLNLQFAIMEDVPSFPADVPNCAARERMFGRSAEHCFILQRSDIERDSQVASLILHEVSRRNAIPLVETAHAFCEGTTCRAERDGVILYKDNDHLNTAGARYLGTRLNIPWPGNAISLGTAALEQRSGER